MTFYSHKYIIASKPTIWRRYNRNNYKRFLEFFLTSKFKTHSWHQLKALVPYQDMINVQWNVLGQISASRY